MEIKNSAMNIKIQLSIFLFVFSNQIYNEMLVKFEKYLFLLLWLKRTTPFAMQEVSSKLSPP